MLNKLKDSMSNLLSMMKPQPADRASGSRENPGMAIRKTAGSKARRVPTPADAEPEQIPATGKCAVAGDQSVIQSRADKQAASGAGNEEGAKEIIRAEQFEAMGKLSAIFGRRAQNIAGEFTTEATQGPQQLKTAYQQRNASHKDVHAKAQRDEVPVAFQEYVERYFELVKKAGAPAKVPHAVTASTRGSRGAR